MDIKHTTPTTDIPQVITLPENYEREVARLRSIAFNEFLDELGKLGRRLLTLWIQPTPDTVREPRQLAMQPDKPKAENLHELGLERFLRPSIN